MQNFFEEVIKANKTLYKADHMLYVSFPLIKDKKMLLKIIFEIKNAVICYINLILKYEHLNNKIILSKDPEINYRLFKEKSSQRYELDNHDLHLIDELFDIYKSHKESPFEFLKNDKLVILSENMERRIVSFEKVKEFMNLAKKIRGKTEETLLRKI